MAPAFRKWVFIMITSGALLFIVWLMSGVMQMYAQIPCKPEELAGYLKTIRTDTMGFNVKQAADCAVKLAPTKETVQLLMDRLDKTLQETKRLKPDHPPTNQADIVVALAEALYVLKGENGYKNIATYFESADWNTRRDQWFFDRIAVHSMIRPEMTETFYLALTRMPASAGVILGTACMTFNRVSDTFIIRDDPRFIRGVISALVRLEQWREVPNKEAAISSCEKTLLSQLLDVKMKEAFLISYKAKLISDEQRILNRFLAKIEPPQDAAAVEQLAVAFFNLPWKAEFSVWQKNNPDLSCKTFHGASYVTNTDGLWCFACLSPSGTLQKRFYFYPDSEGKSCALQKVRFSYPSTSHEIITALTQRLSGRMGAGKSTSNVHDFGAAFWEDIFFWNWQGREVYAFRNKGRSSSGEGLPLIEILGRDTELASAIREEEVAEDRIIEEQKQYEAAKRRRLYQDVAKSLPSLIQRLEKTSDPESQFSVLMELLSIIKKQGSDRAAQLYLANQLAEQLGSAGFGGKLADWQAKQQILSGYGVSYFQTHWMDVIYNHVFIKKIIDEGLSGYWAEEAYFAWVLMGSHRYDGCTDGPTELFKRVIDRGEDFLKKNPMSHIQKELLKAIAEAHETGWSLSLASPDDEYVKAENYQAEAPDYQKKAISYYEQFVHEYPDSPEVVPYRSKLKRLRMGLDTNSRKFFCIYD